MNYEDARTAYMDWLATCTGDERALLERALELEENLFSDMTLKDFAEELGGYEAEMNGRWVHVVADLHEPGALEMCTGHYWRFRIVDGPQSFLGRCNFEEHLVQIAESEKHNELILIDELIHVYEHVLAETTELYRQWLLIRLYDQLLPKPPYLRNLLSFDAHSLVAEHSGYCHGPLFPLKSLELDLRLGKPLGTVYGYGREGEFASHIEHQENRHWSVPPPKNHL